jgi:tetratricopeptide (TPR) repeat protein
MSHLTNAVAAYHAKQYSEAVRLASDGLKLNAHDFHLLHLRANCLTLLKQDSKALIDLKVLMNVYSSDARAYLKAVRCLKKDYSQALKILQDAKDNVDRNDSKYTVISLT